MDAEGSREEALFERLLAKHLAFYDSLRTRERRPKTAAQRQFQDVAWGRAQPVTDHERAYVFHLRRTGIGPFARHAELPHVDDIMDQYPVGARPVSGDVGVKWDNAWREHRGRREFW